MGEENHARDVLTKVGVAKKDLMEKIDPVWQPVWRCLKIKKKMGE